jgi:DNA repair exonuclease SbcCD nuclease subunit
MIVSGERLHGAPVAAAGLLLIGDPHVGSRRPGRRKDDTWPAPILAKLEACVALANARDLAPVLLGDLFDRAVEPDMALKSRLIRVLKGFRIRPVANVGNHDMAHTRLSDGDSLAVLGLCDVIDVVAGSGAVGDYLLGGQRLGLGATPFGQDVPVDVAGLFPGAARVAWLTHHDIAFDKAYPGAVPPHAVAGCDLVVNGHVHKAQKALRAGGTTWHNPGNIARLSVDLIHQEPAVLELRPDGGVVRHVLPHDVDVFDLAGRIVPAAGDRALVADVESAFVSLLQAESAGEVARSDDGAVIREEIEAKFARDGTPETVRAILRSLLAEAVERRG